MNPRCLLTLTLLLSAPACSPTYPKDKLGVSIPKLFKKEVGTGDVRFRVVERTLYVAFPVENMVSASLDLPKDVLEKIESAMLSVTRVAMSTDEKLDFIVLEARDETWGVRTTFIRRVEDLKFLYYMKISKTDFDERFILETRSGDPRKGAADEDWEGLSLENFMARWVAFRLGLGSKSNPFLSVLMGVSKVAPSYDPLTRTLTLSVEGPRRTKEGSQASDLRSQFLKTAVFEQMKKVEKKYLHRLAKGESWARTVRVVDEDGRPVFSAEREEWADHEAKDTDR